MTKETVQRIKNNPKYQELVSKRSKFAWTLSINLSSTTKDACI